MKTLFLSCLLGLLLVLGAFGQTRATPVPVRKAIPVATPIPKRSAASETQILAFGGFELPKVQKRLPKLEGGNFLLLTSDEWMTFQGEPDKTKGTLVIGLTNEIARTGRQSMYLEFNKLRKAKAEAILSSQLIPVKPAKPYRVGLWGRLDKKQPLTIDQMLPSLRLRVGFFQQDGETQTGDEIYRIQPMPGSKDRPAFFTANRWTEYYAEFDTPEDAAFLKITWSWTSPLEGGGETNGIIYFDDATLTGEKVTPPETTEEPATTPAAAAPAENPAPAAAPAVKATPKPPASSGKNRAPSQ